MYRIDILLIVVVVLAGRYGDPFDLTLPYRFCRCRSGRLRRRRDREVTRSEERRVGKECRN